jgi:hypothetical protein
MNIPPHPGFRDVLWDFVCSARFEDGISIRVCASEEELFDHDNADDFGQPWSVPRGLVLKTTRRIEQQLDSQQALQVGQKIWDSLPVPVRDSLLQSGSLPIRLKISSDVKEIIYLPWECLPFSTEGLIARSVPVRYPVPPLTISPPVRVLFIVTNPKDERLLRPKEELSAIQPEADNDYNTEVVWEPTLRGVKEALDSLQPHIVHYIGHGATSSGEGYLVLHDHAQHTYWVSASELATQLPSTVRLMCLSTCFTAENYDIRGLPLFAEAPPDIMIPTTVVNRLPLDAQSKPAITLFWNTFYSELTAGKGDAASAFRAAQTSIREFRDWPSFSLVLRDGTGWSLTLHTGMAQMPGVKVAEFDALYSTSIANYLTQQTGGSSPEVRDALREHSRKEAMRLSEAISSLDSFKRLEKEGY